MTETVATLSCDYFTGGVVDLALDLLGRRLIVRGNNGSLEATIVETEAYGGSDDPASHAAFRPGGRARAMADQPGRVYVYAAYGMYPCFNVVCGPSGLSSAILVRGIWFADSPKPILGPGRVTRAMDISLDDHGSDVCSGRFAVSEDREVYPVSITPRIGITRGTDLPWRFVADVREFSSGG